jgi:hypothetical protein
MFREIFHRNSVSILRVRSLILHRRCISKFVNVRHNYVNIRKTLVNVTPRGHHGALTDLQNLFLSAEIHTNSIHHYNHFFSKHSFYHFFLIFIRSFNLLPQFFLLIKLI